jgi:hypothetical protein
MSRYKSFGKLLAVAVGVFVLTPSLDVHAKPGSGKAGASAPAKLENKLSMRPKAMRWGMSHREVAKAYAKVIEKDYLPQYQKAQPGVQMRQLDGEVADKKEAFANSVVEFADLPTRLDGTPFVGEFTYKNRESLMEIQRKKKHRHLFFIRNELWKVIDVYQLGAKSRYGKDYKTAVAKIEKKMGVKGQVVKANPDTGQKEERRWTDGSTNLRLANFGGPFLAIIYEDARTADKIDSLRTYKPEEKKEEGIDPSTKSVLR